MSSNGNSNNKEHMVATIINIVLLLYAFIQYNKGRYAWPLFILTFFASNAFIVNIGEPVIKYTDFGLLLLFGCSILGSLRDPSFFTIRKYTGAKISLFFLVFFILEFLYAYLFNIDRVGNIVAVLRGYLYALSYFVFRKMSISELQKAIYLIFKAVVFSCIVYVIQFFTHLPLTTTFVSSAYSGGYRMQITPPFIDLIFLMLLLYSKKNKWILLCIILIFLVQLLSQNRTPLIGWFLEIGLFVVVSKNTKHKFTIIFVALLAFPFVNSLLSSRSENEHSTSLSSTLFYLKSRDYYGLSGENTFMFRIALIAERADYLIENPNLFLQGVGAMHEDTAQKKFDFSVGTGGYDEIKRCNVIAQLDSIDVVWGPLLIRYGFLGLALFLTIVIWIIWVFYKKRSNPNMMLGFLTYISALAQSFSSGGLFSLLGVLTMMGFLIIYDRNISYSIRKSKLIPVTK